MTALNVDKIMGAVRMAMIRRKVGSMASVANGGEQASSTAPLIWAGARPPSEVKPEYRLDELLVYADREFVDNAYRVILRRAPDPEGLAHYLGRLRAGMLSKVEVLGQLRWSAEGMGRSVHVDGLLLPYTLYKAKRWRFVGPMVKWLHGVWRVGSVATRMEGQEARLGQAIEELGTHSNRISLHLSAQISALEADYRRLADERDGYIRLHDDVDELRAAVDVLVADTRAAATDRARIEHIEGYLPGIESRLEVMHGLASRLDEVSAEVTRQIGDLEGAVHQVQADVGALVPRVDSLQSQVDSLELPALQHERANHALEPLYVAFESKFRGSPQLIESRAEPYLDILREANVGDPAHPVLDIGSGNGEWLDVLRRNGFSARGVDNNSLFVELCAGRGLQVEHADALEYLRAVPDGSLGAITALHVAEHLPFEVLIELLDEARRALCIGGVIALETPNPENLIVGSHYFYMDPTHRNPIPPEALRWLVEARGFERCRIERWTIARELPVPPMLPDEGDTTKTINAVLAHFHAAPDYAVVGRRL